MNKTEKKRFDKFYQRYFKPKLSYIVLLIIIITFGVVFGNLSPFVYGKILDFISDKNIDDVKQYIFIYFGISILALLLGIIEGYIGTLISYLISSDVRRSLYQKIMRMRIRSLDKYSIGELLSRLDSDANAIVNFYIDVATSLIMIIFNLIVSVYFVFKISLSLSFVSLFFIPASSIINLIFRNKFRILEKRQKEYSDRYLGFINVSFSNIRGVRSYQIEDIVENKFKEFINQKLSLIKYSIRLGNYVSILNQIIQTGFYLLIIYLSARFIITGVLTIGSMVAFNAYIDKLFSSVSRLLSLNMNFQAITVCMDRIDLLESEPDEILMYFKKHKNDIMFDSIKLENIKFKYKDDYILNGLSLYCEGPGFYSIVGKNGCGKSTLIKLIMGFYDCESGRILLGNMNKSELGLADIRKKITYVQKETFLIDDTVLNNIKMVDLEASYEEIIELCKQLNFHEFIESLPKGYNTILGENGSYLSSGQKQKISIARSFLRDSDIILFDEITSDLDGKTEKEVVNLIKGLSKKKIVIFISHKITSIIDSDRIFVIDEGMVQSYGNHHELILESEIYRELFLYDSESIMA